MKIQALVPLIYNNRLYLRGTVLQVSPLEGGRLVHNRVAVPVPEVPTKQVVRPVEVRHHG